MTLDKKHSVLILGKLPPPYMGPSIATQIILNSKLKNEFNLIHLDTRAYENLTEFGEISFGKLKKNFAIYSQMLSIISEHKPSMVLIPISQTTSGFIKDSIFIHLAKRKNVKALLQLRGSDFKNWIGKTNFITKWYVKFSLAKANGIIVLGNNLKHLFAEYFKDKNIHVVSNGGDYKIPEKSNIADKTVHILHLSNLHAPKGIEDIIDALIELKSRNIKQPYKVTAIGNWIKEDSKERCLSKVKEHILPIEFFSQEKSAEKLQYLANSDIFVFTPRDPEGHPWVIVEAMAAGLPIISTDQGAIIESVQHEVNGYIIPSNNGKALAEKMELLINNSDLRNSFGKKSRALYEEKFTEEKMVTNLTSVFNKVINN